MSEPTHSDAAEAVAPNSESVSIDGNPATSASTAAANSAATGTRSSPGKTEVREVLDRARHEEGVAVLATYLHEGMHAALVYVDGDFVRHPEIEQLVPLEAAMALDAMLANVAAHARGRAERMLALPVDVTDMPDLDHGRLEQERHPPEPEPPMPEPATAPIATCEVASMESLP